MCTGQTHQFLRPLEAPVDFRQLFLTLAQPGSTDSFNSSFEAVEQQ
jgi:hypothetical protein